ncbi:asparagine--tRNA ligase [Sporosalibacterium faouarense]|uniref:asparagine--tRNA ligase n=1 Tax=Sporosalibacterium faouarense TaxID=516123 RepID=UPI00192CC41B|nr:asparagine--tRNA ligase [Sporosalibacterium faouarense]
MKISTIKSFYRETEKYIDQEIKISGWVRTVRGSKKFGFIEVNDGTFFKGIQVVINDELENFKELTKLSISAGITVEGKIVETPNAKQPFEIQASSVVLEADSESDYPLQKKRHTFEYLRTIAHLRPRSNTFSAVFRVRSLLSFAIHKFFQERGFVYVNTPIVTASDAEGAGEMFRVTTLDIENLPRDEEGKIDFSKDFFAKETNLTVSGQLEAEAYALAYRQVYNFGPTFRAENSNTTRHAAEFWMMEPEIAFADINDNMDLAEDMLKYIIKYVLDNAPEEMEFFNKFIDKGLLDRLQNIVDSEFVRITYTKAIEILEESGQKFDFPVKWGIDLASEHEKYLTDEVYKKPVFVTDYPKEIKAFYMRLNDDGKTVAAMDLLAPGIGEIIGGSQREERHDVLVERMKEFNIHEEDLWWYLELRKYGGVKHAGYGLGFERAVMYVTGMKNIRDVVPFPRTVKSADF